MLIQSFCCCFSQVLAVIGGEGVECACGLGEIGGEVLVVSDGSVWVSGGGVVRGGWEEGGLGGYSMFHLEWGEFREGGMGDRVVGVADALGVAGPVVVLGLG